MKKRTLFVAIIILLIIFIAILLAIEFNNYETYTGVITDIYDNCLIFDCPSSVYPYAGIGSTAPSQYGHKVIIHGEEYVTLKYSAYFKENTVFKDNSGKKISISDFKVGDSIAVVNRKKNEARMDSLIKGLTDVRTIQILKND